MIATLLLWVWFIIAALLLAAVALGEPSGRQRLRAAMALLWPATLVGAAILVGVAAVGILVGRVRHDDQS